MMKFPYCYCVSCYSGEEEKVADKIRRICGCYSLVPRYEREEKKKGTWEKRRHVLLPGYIFLYSETPLNFGLFYGISQLTGPVGITAMIEETVQFGITPVLNIVSLIAVNLGVVNLLPLPALDGGRIFFILVEAVIRRPIPPQKEGLVHMIGFILLMALTVFVFVNDIIRVVS